MPVANAVSPASMLTRRVTMNPSIQAVISGSRAWGCYIGRSEHGKTTLCVKEKIMAGRPTKLTPELQKTLVAYLKNGNYFDTACSLSGICEDTGYHWLERGKKGKNGGIYSQFSEAVKEAVAYAEKDALISVRTGRRNWQSEAWFLERRFNDKWGRREKQEVDHTGTVHIEFVPAKPREDEEEASGSN